MAKTYQLECTAFMDGALQRAGYRFTLPDGVRPPMRAVSGPGGMTIDEPLAVEVASSQALVPVPDQVPVVRPQ